MTLTRIPRDAYYHPTKANPEPVLDPTFWKKRLDDAGQYVYRAIYNAPEDELARQSERHRQILKKYISPDHFVLDAGCGYGRLLELMPEDWKGAYTGIDLSPDLIALARKRNPGRTFIDLDLRDLKQLKTQWVGPFDWCVCVSLKYTIIGNCGKATWDEIEEQLRRFCKDILFLEFDPEEEPDYLGTLESVKCLDAEQ